jgi:hypothetical protein
MDYSHVQSPLPTVMVGIGLFCFEVVKPMAIALGFSRELARLTRIMAQDRVTLGYVGEEYAKVVLEAHGYITEIDHEAKHGDLHCMDAQGNIIRVEVKTSRIGKDKYFTFNLRKWRNGVQTTNCTKCDALFLQCVRPSGLVEFYVIPHYAVSDINIIKIRSKATKYPSRWKQYRQYEGSITFRPIVEANRGVLAVGDMSHVDFPFRRDHRFSFK